MMMVMDVMMRMNCSESSFHLFYIYSISKKFLQAVGEKFYANI